MQKVVGLLFGLFGFWFSVQAQVTSPITSRTCGATYHREHIIRRFPETAPQMEKAKKAAAAFSQTHRNLRTAQPVIQIPVVFHVLYHTPEQNISEAQILSQLQVLNEDYRRRNADTVKTLRAFKSVAADTQIQFCLATIDPNGQPTTGITRTYTDSAAFNLEDNMKFANRGGKNAWNTTRYLNIWVCNLGNQVLGYGQFPGSPAAIDGVTLFYKAVGRYPANPNQDFLYNQGRTATHEIGHWLGLEHIWGIRNSGCDDSDGIDDTPNQDDANNGCPTGTIVSCNNAGQGGDMYQNYMDYTDDACMNLFTRGQGEYMYAIINAARPGLLTAVVCQFPLRTDFAANDSIFIAGTTVQFTDNSIGLRATSWQWTFEGGTPATSTAQNPTVLYENPGKYPVTLTVSAGSITDTKTKVNYIQVTPSDPTIYPNPAQEEVTISLPADYKANTILLINSVGQIVRTIIPQSHAVQIRLAGLANGIYYIKVIQENGATATKKLIVIK